MYLVSYSSAREFKVPLKMDSSTYTRYTGRCVSQDWVGTEKMCTGRRGHECSPAECAPARPCEVY